MTPCQEVLQALQPAYAPCAAFADGACAQLRWAPEEGHVPRGFCGAIASAEEVRLVLVCAEPGNPHFLEKHVGDGTPDGMLQSVSDYAWQCFEKGPDLFHRNIRRILDLCWPGVPFQDQMRWTWITDSVLCSAKVEGGRLPVKVEGECGRRYLVPQLKLFPSAVVAALGRKAEDRLKRAGITDFVAAGVAAPPACNMPEVAESWSRLAELVRQRFPS